MDDFPARDVLGNSMIAGIACMVALLYWVHLQNTSDEAAQHAFERVAQQAAQEVVEQTTDRVANRRQPANHFTGDELNRLLERIGVLEKQQYVSDTTFLGKVRDAVDEITKPGEGEESMDALIDSRIDDKLQQLSLGKNDLQSGTGREDLTDTDQVLQGRAESAFLAKLRQLLQPGEGVPNDLRSTIDWLVQSKVEAATGRSFHEDVVEMTNKHLEAYDERCDERIRKVILGETNRLHSQLAHRDEKLRELESRITSLSSEDRRIRDIERRLDSITSCACDQSSQKGKANHATQTDTLVQNHGVTQIPAVMQSQPDLPPFHNTSTNTTDQPPASPKEDGDVTKGTEMQKDEVRSAAADEKVTREEFIEGEEEEAEREERAKESAASAP